MSSGSGEPPSVLDTTIKAALRAVPTVGSSLSVIFEDARTRHAHRTAQAITDVAEQVGADDLLARISSSEAFEVLFIDGIDIATRTGLQAKRKLMAKVVSKAAIDDAKIDTAQLVLSVLRRLDAPHFRALARLRAAEDKAEAESSEPAGSDTRSAQVTDAMVAAGRAEPTPIIAALIQTGVAYPATFLGGGTGIYRVTEFGREVLADLEREAAWS